MELLEKIQSYHLADGTIFVPLEEKRHLLMMMHFCRKMKMKSVGEIFFRGNPQVNMLMYSYHLMFDTFKVFDSLADMSAFVQSVLDNPNSDVVLPTEEMVRFLDSDCPNFTGNMQKMYLEKLGKNTEFLTPCQTDDGTYECNINHLADSEEIRFQHRNIYGLAENSEDGAVMQNETHPRYVLPIFKVYEFRNRNGLGFRRMKLNWPYHGEYLRETWNCVHPLESIWADTIFPLRK